MTNLRQTITEAGSFDPIFSPTRSIPHRARGMQVVKESLKEKLFSSLIAAVRMTLKSVSDAGLPS